MSMTNEQIILSWRILDDIPKKIVAFDNNPKGLILYVEQRKEIADALASKGYGKVNDAVLGVLCKIRDEIKLALDSNYKVLNEHANKENSVINELVNRVKGKIDALRGIDDFILEIQAGIEGSV